MGGSHGADGPGARSACGIRRGPESLAVFQSAKCSNEENYLLQRMFRGGLGTNNVDHCTRLCHSSSVSAMQRAMNTSAASGSMREVETRIGRHLHPRREHDRVAPGLWSGDQTRGEARREADRGRSATIELAARAHIHLQPVPGTDVALMNAMLNHILAMGLEDKAFIAAARTTSRRFATR